jgi:hypothetical protein
LGERGIVRLYFGEDRRFLVVVRFLETRLGEVLRIVVRFFPIRFIFVGDFLGLGDRDFFGEGDRRGLGDRDLVTALAALGDLVFLAEVRFLGEVTRVGDIIFYCQKNFFIFFYFFLKIFLY